MRTFFSEKTKVFNAWNGKRKAANRKSTLSSSVVTRRKGARYDEDGYERDFSFEKRSKKAFGVSVVERVDDLIDREAQGSPKQKMRVEWVKLEGNGRTSNGNGNGGVVMGNEDAEEEMEEIRSRRGGNTMIDWTRRIRGKERVADVEARVQTSKSNASPKGRG